MREDSGVARLLIKYGKVGKELDGNETYRALLARFDHLLRGDKKLLFEAEKVIGPAVKLLATACIDSRESEKVYAAMLDSKDPAVTNTRDTLFQYFVRSFANSLASIEIAKGSKAGAWIPIVADLMELRDRSTLDGELMRRMGFFNDKNTIAFGADKNMLFVWSNVGELYTMFSRKYEGLVELDKVIMGEKCKRIIYENDWARRTPRFSHLEAKIAHAAARMGIGMKRSFEWAIEGDRRAAERLPADFFNII